MILLDQLNAASVTHARLFDAAQFGIDRALLAGLDPAVVERIAVILENFDATPLGMAELADRLGRPRGTIDQWGQRDLLPPATWTVGGRRAWATSVADIWALLTNRAENLATA